MTDAGGLPADAATDSAASSGEDASASSCSAKLPSDVYRVGLELRAPSSLPAKVESVTASELTLRTPSGEQLKFSWFGPSLLGEFSVDEQVDATWAPNGWSSVRGARTTAAVQHRTDFLPPRDPLVVPGIDLTFNHKVACVEPQPPWCGLTVKRDILDVLATTGDETVTIAPGATQTVADFRVTNVRNADRYQSGGVLNNSGCSFDPASSRWTSVLYPTRVSGDD